MQVRPTRNHAISHLFLRELGVAAARMEPSKRLAWMLKAAAHAHVYQTLLLPPPLLRLLAPRHHQLRLLPPPPHQEAVPLSVLASKICIWSVPVLVGSHELAVA